MTVDRGRAATPDGVVDGVGPAAQAGVRGDDLAAEVRVLLDDLQAIAEGYILPSGQSLKMSDGSLLTWAQGWLLSLTEVLPSAAVDDDLWKIATGEPGADHDPRCEGDCGPCGGCGGVEAMRCLTCGGDGKCKGCSVGYRLGVACRERDEFRAAYLELFAAEALARGEAAQRTPGPGGAPVPPSTSEPMRGV